MADFIHRFLFGDTSLKNDGEKVSAAMVMDLGKEGWVGIPHGGIGMGAILELAEAADRAASCRPEAPCPMSFAFRMGGSGARVGDSVMMEAMAADGKINGAITVVGADMPYISAEIGFGEVSCQTDEYARGYVPAAYGEIAGK
ncbi:MAG: hypothetical protein COX19_05710, partial [Desulfobacterales bacterium CG23_combo_of_CG06-09_8_20_14_all_51_8]